MRGPKTGNEWIGSLLVDQRIRNAIVVTLNAWVHKVVKDNPDFSVAYQLGIRNRFNACDKDTQQSFNDLVEAVKKVCAEISSGYQKHKNESEIPPK